MDGKKRELVKKPEGEWEISATENPNFPQSDQELAGLETTEESMDHLASWNAMDGGKKPDYYLKEEQEWAAAAAGSEMGKSWANRHFRADMERRQSQIRETNRVRQRLTEAEQSKKELQQHVQQLGIKFDALLIEKKDMERQLQSAMDDIQRLERCAVEREESHKGSLEEVKRLSESRVEEEVRKKSVIKGEIEKLYEYNGEVQAALTKAEDALARIRAEKEDVTKESDTLKDNISDLQQLLEDALKEVNFRKIQQEESKRDSDSLLSSLESMAAFLCEPSGKMSARQRRKSQFSPHMWNLKAIEEGVKNRVSKAEEGRKKAEEGRKKAVKYMLIIICFSIFLFCYLYIF